MESKSNLLQYYMDYCEKVAQLSVATRRNYHRGLKKVSSFLRSKGLIESEIYEIQSIEQLKSLKEILSTDQDFIAFNSKGHRMYSAALHMYIEFASGEEWSRKESGIRLLDQPMPVMASERVERVIRPRLDIVKHQALEAAGYCCELDAGHQTFPVEGSGKAYMEAHHAIPMSLQELFTHSLDVYANIVCLCPTCHRKIHYGGLDVRRTMAMFIYEKRSTRLERSGLELTKERFVALAAPDRMTGSEKLVL